MKSLIYQNCKLYPIKSNPSTAKTHQTNNPISLKKKKPRTTKEPIFPNLRKTIFTHLRTASELQKPSMEPDEKHSEAKKTTKVGVPQQVQLCCKVETKERLMHELAERSLLKPNFESGGGGR